MAGPIGVSVPTGRVSLFDSKVLAAVERPMEDLIDRRVHPSDRASLLRPRSGNALSVECLGNPGVAPASRAHLEYATYDCGFGVVDSAFDVRSQTVAANNLDVVISEASTTGDVAGARMTNHRTRDSLPRRLAFEFVGVGGQRQQDLVGGESSVRSRSSR